MYRISPAYDHIPLCRKVRRLLHGDAGEEAGTAYGLPCISMLTLPGTEAAGTIKATYSFQGLGVKG